ncbi:hypothetical protein [Streptomyces sp. enrichment culture]|uniref:hypothetical protein n=1 Tax=Streptomyces sp. enrichment culture TaxID=1795815 RepID=UPI003F5459EB
MMKHTTAFGALVLTGALLLTGCGGDEEKPAAEAKASASAAPAKAKPVPPYKITLQKLVGGVPHIDVEVDSKENLRGVFEKVANDSKESGQHEIRIACSTGGTKGGKGGAESMNLLAWGTYTPNLWQGDIQLPKGGATFTEEEGTSCPAK